MGEDRRGIPGGLRLGCHTTPERLDGRGLCDAFDRMVVGPASPISSIWASRRARPPPRANRQIFPVLDRQW
jgi:hypothetical protein